MVTPNLALYPLLLLLLQTMLGPLHTATLTALTALTWALLAAQSLHPADLARALPVLRTAKARQAFRRVRRVFDRTVLHSTFLTPRLIPVVLRLVADTEVTLVLDSTRCHRWEIFTLGVRFHGHVLPIAWSILPYPWPKKQFTPTVVALLDRTLACWPDDRSVHLVADRGFPSLPFFCCLERWQQRVRLGYTIRLRAGDWVRLDGGQVVKVATLMQGIALGTWQRCPASYHRRGKAGPASWLLVGRGLPVYPPHQQGPADRARRQAKAERRASHLRSKGQAQAAATDGIWVLLTTASTCVAGIRHYMGRSSTEGTYRDWKAWDLEAVAGHETDVAHLDGLLGLAALAYVVQVALGAAAGRAEDAPARARQQQWSTTDRLSVSWRGRQVLHDRGYDWRPWLNEALHALVQQLGDPRRTDIPTRQRPTTRRKEAA